MAVGWEVRLGVLILLLSLQIFALATDFGVFKPRDSSNTGDSTEKSSRPTTRPSRAISQIVSPTKSTKWFLNPITIKTFFAPLLSVAVGVVLISIAFSNTGRMYRDTDAECNTNVDADISGDGVRASIWAQIGVLIFISAIGLLHTFDTGIKEVAGGLVLTHVSLVIALIVQMRRGTLTSVDAAVGAAILDAQNVALQIPFSHKETLAARWQVILIVPTQILGLIVLPILVTGLARGDFASEGCECLHLFWWSWINDCGDGYRDDDRLSCFYVYYSLRWVMALRLSCEALYKAGRYHRAEKSARLKTRLSDEEEAKMSVEQYERFPGTVSLSYLICALYSLTSMAVAEMTTRDFELHASSSVSSVGQIIAIVVAGSTILRAVWEFVGMFNAEKESSFPDLVFQTLRFVFYWLTSRENLLATASLPCLIYNPSFHEHSDIEAGAQEATQTAIQYEEALRDEAGHELETEITEEEALDQATPKASTHSIHETSAPASQQHRPPTPTSPQSSPLPLSPSSPQSAMLTPAHYSVETLAQPQLHGTTTHETTAPASTEPQPLSSPQPHDENRPGTPAAMHHPGDSGPVHVPDQLYHERPRPQPFRFTFRNPFDKDNQRNK